ncbi:hypothetical protein B566_EDAN006593 [Ephemera danica]|nr:hypothetical protein B566_EDAN006593 [Ephemera danica]
MEPTQSAATVRPTSSLSQTSQSTHSSAPSPSSTPSGSRANSSLGSPDMMFGHEARQKKSDGKIETLFMEVSERQEWKNLFRKYLPTLQLPTRHEISGPLLDQEYNETKSKVESKVSNAEAVALQMDGWENLR